MCMSPSHRRNAIDNLPTVSAKIRALADQGMSRADIARRLDIRYQHVRNVLEYDKARQAKAAEAAAPASAESIAPIKTRLGPDGRVVIPAPFRDALSLKEGDV